MFLDQKRLFFCTRQKIYEKLIARGGVNPCGQPDCKISGFFMTLNWNDTDITGLKHYLDNTLIKNDQNDQFSFVVDDGEE